MSVMAGGSSTEIDAREIIAANSEVAEDGSAFWFGLDQARAGFYHDCPEEVVRWAYKHLTPQSIAVLSTPVSVPLFWEMEPPRSFIGCTEDRLVPPDYAARIALRLGVEPLFIESSHSPFFSRPIELAELLVRAVGTTPVSHLQPTDTDAS